MALDLPAGLAANQRKFLYFLVRRVGSREAAEEILQHALRATEKDAWEVRLHRARQALRKQVELWCRTCAEHGCLDCTCKL